MRAMRAGAAGLGAAAAIALPAAALFLSAGPAPSGGPAWDGLVHKYADGHRAAPAGPSEAGAVSALSAVSAVSAPTDLSAISSLSAPSDLSTVSAPSDLSAVSAPTDLSAVSAPSDLSSLSALSDLEWLAGAWSIERPGEQLDERWGVPVGNAMVGHFRWTRDGELWMTELLTITEEAGEVVFRLRHFSSRMRPWEAEDDALEYRLTERAARRAAFTILEPRAGRPDRFVFEAVPGDSLVVRLEAGSAGEPEVQEFRYGAAPR